jgi:NADH-quinone oxidoreductase subunit C
MRAGQWGSAVARPKLSRGYITMTLTKNAVSTLKKELNKGVLAVESFRDQTTLVLDREVIVRACEVLRDTPGLEFNRLASLTAVDYWPKEPRFAVIYQLYSVPNAEYFRLSVPLQGSAAEVPTVEGVYLNANWFEREVFDMFGITFNGHSDLRRILMPHDWEGHPLRKDYPLGYEEIQFSFNFDEIDRKKPYAKE